MNNSDSVDSSPDGCVGEKRSVSEEELIDAVTQSPNLQTDTVIPSSGIPCGTSSTVSIEEAQNMEMPISVEKNLEMDTNLGIAQTLEKLSVADNQAVTCEDNLHGLSIASGSVSDHTLPPPLNSDNISVDETDTKEVRGDRPNPFNFSVGQGTSKLHEKYKNLGNFLPLETFGNDELAGSFIQPNSFTGFSGNDSTFLNTDINSKYTTDGQVVDEKYLFSSSESRQTSTSSNTTSSNSDPWVKISPNETHQNNSPEISSKLCENDEAENDKTVDLNGMPKLDESLSSGVGLKKAPTIQNYVPLSPHVLDIPGPCEPEDLIEGIIFSANYLGTTQLASNKNSAKNARMFQAQEAVNRIKAPDGESQPTVEVDLFISTSKVKILNADTQETMMSHTLRSISYIADVGDLLVVMAKRHSSNEDRNGGEDGVKEQAKRHKIICHVLSSSDSHLIAESIGQCFNVAYQQFLQSNCIEPENLTQADFNNLLDTQEMYHDDLVHYSKQENVKEIWVEKKKGEAMGVAIVESGWGSIIPTVILANLQHGSPIERNGKFSIGDQIMAINSTSMVGLPLQTCHSIIKGLRNQTLVKINIVSCPPVVSVLIKRPDLKHQLGFSVQNGIICSLMRGGIAERGGVRVGHRIIEISNQSVVATPHDKIVQMLVTSVGEIQMKTMPAAMYRLLTGQEQPIYL